MSIMISKTSLEIKVIYCDFLYMMKMFQKS